MEPGLACMDCRTRLPFVVLHRSINPIRLGGIVTQFQITISGEAPTSFAAKALSEAVMRVVRQIDAEATLTITPLLTPQSHEVAVQQALNIGNEA